jgi:hypothetical protein
MHHTTNNYLSGSHPNQIRSIVQNVDKDVERGEDILMSGLGLAMMSAFLAPIAPPTIVLPLVAIIFAVSSSLASRHYRMMKHKLGKAVETLESQDNSLLKPIAGIFSAHPPSDLSIAFNPLKNPKRTLKSIAGGILVNPFWMPIFYMVGIQISEEKKFGFLNLAIMGIEKKLNPAKDSDLYRKP